MEQRDVKCTIDDIQEMSNVFEKNHSEIINTLKLFEKELVDMPNVLNTPNSSKIMPEFLEYLKKQEENVIEKDVYFKKVFKTIIDEYKEFMIDTKDSIGGE